MTLFKRFLTQRFTVLIGAIFMSYLSLAQNNFDLIPKPVSLQTQTGIFTYPELLTVQYTVGFEDAAHFMEEHPAVKRVLLSPKTGENWLNGPTLRIEKVKNSHPNAYSIEISSENIQIQAQDSPQAIQAVATLIQLAFLQNDASRIGAVKITDEPRFGYRGLHLDVSRHFFPLSFVIKYIDLMALYKFNTFHWHITDGAGWRLEIKKYPELTEKAAWRSHAKWKDWWNNGRQYVDKGEPNAYGGFYTQDQARKLVAYAQKKGITVIPEIEMPGHSEEVIAVYPQLSCTGIPYTQSEFCIGNPETFVFLKNVLDEVLEIFPSEYIHIGGDEADKRHWKECPKDQALMQREGLKNVDELQSYAIRQMDEYLQSKGRKLIGWDEILEGGLTPGATVMSWRGEEGGIKSANAGHDVIMTPGGHLYFDAYQSDPRTQPEAIGGYLTTGRVYSYDPIPHDISPDKAHHVLGAQANIWTEYIPTTEHVEYMAYPRVLALSEVNWTQPAEKDWDDFHSRLQSHYKLLQDLNVNYYRPSYNVVYESVFNSSDYSSTISLITEQNNPENIHFTLDGSRPTSDSPSYTGPFKLTQSGSVKAAYFFNGIQIGPLLEFEVDIHRAIGKPVKYNRLWDSYIAQGEATLTNGIMGGLTYHDGQWQGFTGPMDVVVDMEKVTEINSVAMYFMQMISPGVYMPGEMRVSVSNDGKNFREVGVDYNDISDQEEKLTFKRFEVKLKKSVKARYMRVKATNPKRGYIFTDEVIVY